MTGPDPVVTAIIEDHPLFRDALAAVVEATSGLRLGPVVEDLDTIEELFAAEPPGLALVDYSLEDVSAPDLIRTIRKRFPECRCLVLSGHANPQYAVNSLEAGALGYILKGRPDELTEATQAVLAGNTYVSQAVAPD